MRSPMVAFTLTIPSSYLMGRYNYPSMTKKWNKNKKTGFLTSASISLPHTQNVYHGQKINVQPSHAITHNALNPHDPTQMTHRPSQPLFHDQKWQKMVDKQVLSISASITSSLHTNAPHRLTNVVQVSYASPMACHTLMTLHSYPTSLHSHSSATKNHQKLFINMFCWLLPSHCPFWHMDTLYGTTNCV